jgi:hypothetical protein
MEGDFGPGEYPQRLDSLPPGSRIPHDHVPVFRYHFDKVMLAGIKSEMLALVESRKRHGERKSLTNY